MFCATLSLCGLVMAPNRGKTTSSKSSKRSSSRGEGSGNKKGRKPSSQQPVTKKNMQLNANIPKKRKQRTYTEMELNIPQLNMITPTGVQKPRGKKKGKVFVDDQVRAKLSHT